jgi:hypothetical protein
MEEQERLDNNNSPNNVQQVMVAAIEANRIIDSIDAELTLYKP